MIYNQLIESALVKGRAKEFGGEYYENHHIKPTALGGLDIVTNMVLLTAREHYIAHALLVFIHKNNTYNHTKMLWAYNVMRGWKNKGHTRTYNCNSHLYEKLKGKYRHTEETKKKMSESGKGHKMSDAAKLKLSNTRKARIASGLIDRPIGEKNGMFGKEVSDETRKKISAKSLGVSLNLNDTQKQKKSDLVKGKKNPMYGKTHSIEARKKISESNKGRIDTLERTEQRRQTASNRIHIHNDNKGKFVLPLDYENNWKELGWLLGMKPRVDFKPSPVSDETKKKMSDAAMGRKDTPETTEKRRKSSSNKIHIHKGLEGKFVTPEIYELVWKSLGWKLGMKPRKK